MFPWHCHDLIILAVTSSLYIKGLLPPPLPLPSAVSSLEVITGEVLADCRSSPLMMCRKSEARQNPDCWHISFCSVLFSPEDRLPNLLTNPFCSHIWTTVSWNLRTQTLSQVFSLHREEIKTWGFKMGHFRAIWNLKHFLVVLNAYLP